MREIVLDFETANPDQKLLKEAGAWCYADDVLTEILCCVFGPDPEHLYSWRPGRPGNEKRLHAYAANPNILFVSHGDFEVAIWRKIMVPLGFPNIPDKRWHDIMAVAATKALPLNLENLSEVLHIRPKDKEGNRFTLAMSKFDKSGNLDKRPESYERVVKYCEEDVKGEWEAHRKLGMLPENEQWAYELHRAMNRRGVRLDPAFLIKCQEVYDRAAKPLAARFVELTELKHTQTVALAKKWGMESVGADAIKEALANKYLMPDQREAMEIRQQINSTSVKKIKPMLASIGQDGRTRGLSQFHGAHPGRNTGRLWQPYNLPRSTLTCTPDDAVEAVMTGDPDYVEIVLSEAPIKAVGSVLRHAIVPEPGHIFLAGDYRQIQARIVLALAGQHDKLELIASGANIYCDMAQTIYGRPIDKDSDPKEYQIGKAAVLGLGFGMGPERFQEASAPHETLEFCEEIVEIYRHEWAPQVRRLWKILNAAAVVAMGGKAEWGLEHDTPIPFQKKGDWLMARLPSGRQLYYFRPMLKMKTWTMQNVRGEKGRDYPEVVYQTVQGHKMAEISAYGGRLTENVVMGMEVDIQRRGWKNCVDNGFPIVMEVYDQLVAEVLESDADLKWFAKCMTDMRDEPWVKELGIPVEVDCWQGYRYRK
jgi:DNA polymerase bacteriophage-type